MISDMAMVNDRCICLRKVEYSETSQILTLFARARGPLRVIAKGAHRKTKVGASKFGGGIDLLDSGDATFTHGSEKDLATLTEWNLTDGHLELRKNLRSMYLALYAAEMVTLMIEEHDAHTKLFDRLEQTLAELGTKRVEETFLAFELDLLREAGYLPELSACVTCGRVLTPNDRPTFSPAQGGMLCRNCQGVTPDRFELDPRLLSLTQGLLRLPRSNGSIQRLPQLTRHQTDPINRMLSEHIQHTLSKRLRMTKYVVG